MIRSAIGTVVLLACGLVAAAAQQAPAPSTEPAHQVYVLTGCLESGAAASSFTLTGASAVGQAPPRQTASSSGSVKPDEYVLQPVTGVGEQGITRERLQEHVGMRVEVTLRPIEAAPSTPSPSSSTTSSASSTPASASAASKGKPEDLPPPRYRVIKIGRLADSCG